MGALAIRVLAGGALNGSAEPHPLASRKVGPMGTGSTFTADQARAARFTALVRDGHAASVPEAAFRYALSDPRITSVLGGYSSLAHLENAAAAIAKGPLPPAALAAVAAIQSTFAGEPR